MVVGSHGRLDPDSRLALELKILPFPFSVIGWWLYFALMESSEEGATIGKQVMGLRVVDMDDGGRIDFATASVRYWSKLVSGGLLLVGCIMAAFTARRQGLHDIIAGTLVLEFQKGIVQLPMSHEDHFSSTQSTLTELRVAE